MSFQAECRKHVYQTEYFNHFFYFFFFQNVHYATFLAIFTPKTPNIFGQKENKYKANVYRSKNKTKQKQTKKQYQR